MVDPNTAGVPLPKEMIAGLLGAETPEQVAFVEQVSTALGTIAPGLVPRLSTHPLADAIAAGVSAFPRLLADYRAQKEEMARAAILDAICEIMEREHATLEVVDALSEILSKSKSQALATLAARGLATAQHEPFLAHQVGFLASDEPSAARISAKLLGYGRYAPAAEALSLCLRPDNMAVADAVLWALGRIGSPAVLPKLHGMLSDLICVDQVIDALGRIGDTTSAIRLLPLLVEGGETQRRAAAQALLRIARKNGGRLGDVGLENGAKEVLERAIDKDGDALVRFYSILAFSTLGGHLAPARVKKALGAKLSKDEMDSVSSFFSGDKPDDGGGKKRKGRKLV